MTIRHLRVVRGGRPALHDLSLAIEAGAVTGLLGPSGSGKTTLMRAIVGVQRIATGAVDVLGLPAGSRALRSRVGYVTQAPAVYDDLTVFDNLRYFGRILGAPRANVDRTLETVGMARLAGQLVGRLSGGERASPSPRRS